MNLQKTSLTLTVTLPLLATFMHEALGDKFYWVLAWPDWPRILFQPQGSWTLTLHKLLRSSVLIKAWNPEIRGGRQKPPFGQRTDNDG